MMSHNIDHIIREHTYGGGGGANGDNDRAFMTLNLDDLLAKHRRWLECLPRVRPYYAVKANNLRLILQILADLGLGFDCSSQAEVEAVLSLNGINGVGVGADGDQLASNRRILFANACKSRAQLQYIRDQQIPMMTFDSPEELDKISRYYPSGSELLIRIKTDNRHSTSKLSLKFGVDTRTDDDAGHGLLVRAKQLGLRVTGVAFHVGSGCQQSEPFVEAIREARRVWDCAREVGHLGMRVLDIGGGFIGSQYLASVPFETIADDINRALDEYFPAVAAAAADSPDDTVIDIIAEPGRYYTMSAMEICTQITGRRVIVHNTNNNDDQSSPIADTNSGHQLLPTIANNNNTNKSIMYYINDGLYGTFSFVTTGHRLVEPIPVLSDDDDMTAANRQRPHYRSVIWGPTCDSYDCVRPDVWMPEMFAGEWLRFRDMGAYSVSAITRFNGMPAPMMLIVANNDGQQSAALKQLANWPIIEKLIADYQYKSVSDLI